MTRFVMKKELMEIDCQDCEKLGWCIRIEGPFGDCFVRKKQCDAGCSHYEGGEAKHLKTCPYYPESLTKINDDKVNNIKDLLKPIIAYYHSAYGDAKWDVDDDPDGNPIDPEYYIFENLKELEKVLEIK
jgi:hypothetical protein